MATQIEAAVSAGATASDISLIQNLKDRAAEFETARLELVRLGPAVARTNDYELLMEYGRLTARADSIKAKITAATKAIDNAISWGRATFGSEGMSSLSSLGLVWFLPAAVITAAVAVIGYWLSDYFKFARRFTEQNRIAVDLVAQGMAPAEAQRQAAEAVAATSPGMFAGIIDNKLLLFGGLLVVGFLVYRGRIS